MDLGGVGVWKDLLVSLEDNQYSYRIGGIGGGRRGMVDWFALLRVAGTVMGALISDDGS